MLWLNSAREGIKKENPDFKVTEIAKKGGELWRGMKDKSEWEAKAAKQKEEYEKAMKEFEKNGGDKSGGAGAKKRGKAPAPKKAGGGAKKSKKKDSDEDDEEEESD
jgi:high mobility group protein B2